MSDEAKDRIFVFFYTMFMAIAALLVLTAFGFSQELKGPAILEPGTITVFEVIPPQEAAWTITPTKTSVSSHYVDTSASKLYFATPTEGAFSIVAAVVKDGKPIQLVATLTNGADNPDPSPEPTPKPNIETEIGKWIKSQIPVLVKSDNLDKEKAAIKSALDTAVEKIDRGEVTTSAMARTKLQIALTENLAEAGEDSVKTWLEFLTEFSKAQDTFLGDKINELESVKKYMVDSSIAFAVEQAKQEPAKEEPKKDIDPKKAGDFKPVEEGKAEPVKPEVKTVKQYRQVCTPRGCYYMEVTE